MIEDTLVGACYVGECSCALSIYAEKCRGVLAKGMALHSVADSQTRILIGYNFEVIRTFTEEPYHTVRLPMDGDFSICWE